MNAVFLPGVSHGPRSLTGYSPYGQKEFRSISGIPFFKKKDYSWELTDTIPYTDFDKYT